MEFYIKVFKWGDVIMVGRRYKAALKDFFYQYGRGTGQGSPSDQQIRFVIRFDGHIIPELLERTLHAVAYIDPILGCRFVETGVLKGYWERRENLDEVRLCEFMETNDPESVIDQFITDLTLPDDAPLYKACLVRSTASDTFCLRVDHRLADGGGTKAIVNLIAEIYREFSINPSLSFEPTVGRFRKRTVMGLINYHGPIHNPERQAPSFRPSPFYIPKAGVRNENAAYALRTMTPDDLLRLKAFGKAHGATINDLILTALIRALQPFSKSPSGEVFAIQVSSDFRSRLPQGIPDPICNLFGAHFPALCYHHDEPFSATLATVSHALAELRRSFTLEEAVQDERFFMDFIRQRAREFGWPLSWGRDGSTHILLSNFTTQDESRIDFGVPIRDALQLGTVSLGNEFMLCASTFRNHLTLSHGYCRSDMEPAMVEEFMDRVVNELMIANGRTK